MSRCWPLGGIGIEEALAMRRHFQQGGIGNKEASAKMLWRGGFDQEGLARRVWQRGVSKEEASARMSYAGVMINNNVITKKN